MPALPASPPLRRCCWWWPVEDMRLVPPLLSLWVIVFGLSMSCVSVPLRADARVDSRHRQSLWVIGDGSPAAVADPGDLATADQLAQLLVDPRAAHPRCLHQVR